MAPIFYGDSETEREALQPRAPGVYLDWPEDDYHADEALSNSNLRRLMIGPAAFWVGTNWNPDKAPEDEKSDALVIGDAYHKRVNEGPEVFAKTYAVAPDPADYPGALMKGDEFKAAIKALNEAKGTKIKVSGTNAELCAALREAGYEGPLWPEIIAKWEDENAGAVKITPADMRKINLAAAILHALPDVGDVWTRGHPEVSVSWINRQGVPMRTRMDRWWPGTVFEFKTTANQMRQPFDVAAVRTMVGEYYHVQAVIHREGAEAALMMPDDMWHGFTPEQIAALKGGGIPDVRFLFIGKSAPDICQRVLAPNVPLDYAFHEDGRPVIDVPRTESELWKSAENIYFQMCARFTHYFSMFGKSPWYNAKPAIGLRDTEPGMTSFALSRDADFKDE